MFYRKMCSTEVGYGYAAILFLALQGMTGGVTRSLSTLVDTPFIKI